MTGGQGRGRRLRAMTRHARAVGIAFRNHPLLAGLLSAAAAAGFLVLLLGPISWWATPTEGLSGKDKADVLNSTRQILLTAVGGLAVLAGLAFTARTYYLSRRGQLTDRYTTAITQLASDKLAERLGGIYALEHLMVESERDHDTVVEVLTAFIRENTSSTTDHYPNLADWHAEHQHRNDDRTPRLATDVQAALTVIGRRPQRPEWNPIDLHGTDLCGANLSGLHLDRAGLGGAFLNDAIMIGTRLNGANLSLARLQNTSLMEAHLRGARLFRASLHGAHLWGAQLQEANLEEAKLQQAGLADADLHGADLNGADLRGADLSGHLLDSRGPSRGLTVGQLAAAVLDETTRLPEEFREPRA
jgi:hypothetical protein